MDQSQVHNVYIETLGSSEDKHTLMWKSLFSLHFLIKCW